VGAVHRAECRDAADNRESPQLIATSWQPTSRGTAKGKTNAISGSGLL
jgi:hypothetical protein